MAQGHITNALAAKAGGGHTTSFEFYPPRSEGVHRELMEVRLPQFVKQGPVFLDFTWGAGGRTSTKTLELCSETKAAYPDTAVNMHITCTNVPQGLVKEALDAAKEQGISNVVALRGDPPAGEAWKPSEDGFSCARDLVKFIRDTYGDYFCISVAGYPEGHPNAIGGSGRISEEGMAKEFEYLKSKVDAGANFIITQLFYDAQTFVDFVVRCREMGITVPILPGLLPIGSYDSYKRMTGLCKTLVPSAVAGRVEELKSDPDALRAYGVQQMVGMIRFIIAAEVGVTHFHFYTVNSTETVLGVLCELGWLQQ